jgi:Spy/CpxP family protein refolding chaperone
MMKPSGTVLSLFAAALVGGCAAPQALDAPPVVAGARQDAPSAATAKDAHEHHRSHPKSGKFGIQKLIRTASKDPTLSAEQADKLKALSAKLEADRRAEKAMKDELRAAIAKGVADGSMDDAEVSQARASALASATSAAHNNAAALNELHKTLDATQRKTLVARLQEHAGHDGAKHDDDHQAPREHGHRQHGRRPHGHAEPAGANQGPEKEAHGWRGARNGQLKFVRDLDLDEGQRHALREAMRKLHADDRSTEVAIDARRERMKAAMSAFEAEAFDAEKLPIAAGAVEVAQKRIDGRIADVRTVLAVLRPEQVQKLAAALASKPARAPEADRTP